MVTFSGLEAHRAFEILHAKIDLLPEKEKEDTWAKFRVSLLSYKMNMAVDLLGIIKA